ncbi:MAG: helix-turn-helix domain-containing protein [Alphaproteobacteria bacterium]
MTVSKAQNKLAKNIRSKRLNVGLTQEGLAERSGVSLPTLRKFEQKGLISLESFLKLSMALGCLGDFVSATESSDTEFTSIDDVLKDSKTKTPKKGWRK